MMIVPGRFSPNIAMNTQVSGASEDTTPASRVEERAMIRYDRCLLVLWIWTFMFLLSTITVFILFGRKGAPFNMIGVVLLGVTLFLLSMAWSMCKSKKKSTLSIQASRPAVESNAVNSTPCYIQQSVTSMYDLPPPYYLCVKLPSYSEAVLTSDSNTCQTNDIQSV